MITLLVIALLLAVNAFYVAAEFAIVGVGPVRVRRLAREGRPTARLLEPVVMDPRRLDRAVAACQIGITVSSLALGAYAQITLSPALRPLLVRLGNLSDMWAQSAAVVVTLLGITAIQVLFGEQLPKSLAVRNPQRWALLTVIPLRLSTLVMWLFVAVLNGSAGILLRLLGVPLSGRRSLYSASEIGWVVADSARAGSMRGDFRDRLQSGLHFSTRIARDLMVPRVKVEAVPESLPYEALRQQVQGSRFTRLPVYRETMDSIIGVVHSRDVLLRREGSGGGIGDLLRPLPVVPSSLPAMHLLEKMRSEGAAMAVVLDEHGGTAGIVTLEDLAEEVLGEMEDEFDADSPRIGRLADGRLRLRGADAVASVNGRYRLRLAVREARTVGGLVMEVLGRVARAGDEVRVPGYLLKVERITGRHIETVLAVPQQPPFTETKT